jgi:hypothetical protein
VAFGQEIGLFQGLPTECYVFTGTTSQTPLADKSSDVGWVEQGGTQHFRLAAPLRDIWYDPIMKNW